MNDCFIERQKAFTVQEGTHLDIISALKIIGSFCLVIQGVFSPFFSLAVKEKPIPVLTYNSLLENGDKRGTLYPVKPLIH